MTKKEPDVTFKGKDAREDLKNLHNHPGWQRIVVYYDRKIAYLEKVITGDIKNDDNSSIIKTIEDLERYRDKRNMAMQFRNLPDILAAQDELNEQTELNLDPFE